MRGYQCGMSEGVQEAFIGLERVLRPVLEVLSSDHRV